MRKNILSICLVCIHLACIAQNNSNTHFLDSKEGSVYVDNTPNTYLTIEFPGDSIKGTELKDAFIIDDKFYQIMKYPYTSEQYTNNADSTKEMALLKYYEGYEVDYIEKEVFKEKLEVKREVFLNESGKRFHLWYYKMPEIDSLKNKFEDMPKWHLYLTFVANQYVCGIYSPVLPDENLSKKLEQAKSMAESVDVFAARVDVGALHYKTTSMAEGKKMEYKDTTRNFSFVVPDWFNILETDQEKMVAGSLPDIDNIKNVILINWYDKKDYPSFKKFNKEKVTGLQAMKEHNGQTILLKKEMPLIGNCNGVNYQIQSLRGKNIYDSNFVTFETKSHYLFLIFTATPKTYKKNFQKFEEFVEAIEIF